MDNHKIETRLVYGFLEAGKTTYIQECILQDYFHKYGTTLILCFEQGEQEYDIEKLAEKKTSVEYYEGETDLPGFCRDKIEKNQPDRIYVEMNIMMSGLRESFPEMMNITYITTRIDWTTLDLYILNFKQMIQQMVSESHQITFCNCPSKEQLASYSQIFRLMNHRATYLRQDPMGYHERAFDLFVPFSLDEPVIEINRERYLPFWLDAAEHPEHYEGKTLVFTDPVELRHIEESEPWSAGRVVMTCCMADLQFMGFEITEGDPGFLNGGWVCLKALGMTGTAEFGRRVLKLKLISTEPAMPPEEWILQTRFQSGS